jgi:hypothetical protein
MEKNHLGDRSTDGKIISKIADRIHLAQDMVNLAEFCRKDTNPVMRNFVI